MPIAVAAVASVSVWVYYLTHKNISTSASSSTNIDDEQQGGEANKSDDIIHREIAIANETSKEGSIGDDGDPLILDRILSRGIITIAYCSTTGTCSGFAKRLHQELLDNIVRDASSASYKVQLIQVSEVDWWDELVNNEEEDDGETTTINKSKAVRPPILLFVLPTWTDGTLPPNSETLLQSLNEISTDWRVAPEPLRSSDTSSQLKVGAFGMGSSAYDASTVGKPAKDVFSTLVGKLGARPLVSKNVGNGGSGGKKGKSLMIGDDEVGDSTIVFEKWMHAVAASIFQSANGSTTSSRGYVVSGKKGKGKANGGKQNKKETFVEGNEGQGGCACKSSNDGNGDDTAAVGCCSSNKPPPQKINEESNSMTDSLSEDDEDDDGSASEGDDDIMDLEDMGDVMKSQSSAMKSKEPQEMVTPKQAKALKKEGYKLIGTHSAVKLCRWTKHQLRGRGGCYKHTHYGITSYQCMEATPSLACANKCVFCWRHHKNPVGREWRWKTDDPKMIVEEAVNMHIDMIKETRGIPGIQMDRWTEAHTVRHCALSLVGEPIMYPKINELLDELHQRKISTFLVTNGQHPKAIEDLIPITQLVSSLTCSTPYFHLPILNIIISLRATIVCKCGCFNTRKFGGY